MPNLPAKNSFTGASVTQAGFKAAFDDLRDFLNNTIGATDSAGLFKAGAGSAAAPTFTFGTDPDTGLYSAGANSLGVAVGGANVATWAAAGLQLAGRLAIGQVAVTTAMLTAIYAVTGSTSGFGANLRPVFQSDVTAGAYNLYSKPDTAAAAFTLSSLYHFHASQGTLGAGSAITSQYGYSVEGNLIGATNNYGFRGAMPSGTGRWNLYMDGTAMNYMAGELGVGRLPTAGSYMLDVLGSARFEGASAAMLVDASSGNSSFTLDRSAGNYGFLNWTTAGLTRFSMYVDNSAESGSNAGSNLLLLSYNDAGTAISTVMNVTRATGATNFSAALSSGSSIKSSGATSGIGYATGAGGTVAQATSKATGVTLNKATGEITMNAASLAADTTVSFTLTNSAIAVGDHLLVDHVSGGTLGSYVCAATCAAGSATVFVRNVTAGALAEAIVLKATLIKAVTA